MLATLQEPLQCIHEASATTTSHGTVGANALAAESNFRIVAADQTKRAQADVERAAAIHSLEKEMNVHEEQVKRPAGR